MIDDTGGQKDWAVAYYFERKYVKLFGKHYFGWNESQTEAFIKEVGLDNPEDFRRRWESLAKDQKSAVLEKASLGAEAVLKQYEESSEAQAIRREVDKAARRAPLDEETIRTVKRLLNKLGNELEYIEEVIAQG